VGNTPAVSLTASLPQGTNASALLLGCGDIRHILYTAYVERGFPERKLDVTACDIEEHIISKILSVEQVGSVRKSLTFGSSQCPHHESHPRWS